MIVKTEAFVLNSRNYSDSSKILVLFTKECGKISVLARGGAKPKSKFGYSIQPLVHSEVNYYEKSSRSLQVLSASEIINRYKNISLDFKCLASAMMIVELVSLSQHENEKNETIFDDILIAMDLLNNNVNPFAVVLKFQIKLAKDMGFGLSFGRELGEVTTPNVLFSLSNCGLNGKSSNNFNIKRIYLERLNELRKTSLQNNVDYVISNKEFIVLLELMTKYFSFHLDRTVKFKSFSLYNL